MSTQTQPAPVLAWHREAHQAVLDAYQYGEGKYDAASIIAAHDPHAKTVRLLERAHQWLDGSDSRISAQSKLADEIRAHLAALQQEGAAK